jgi:hypothetical protein
VLVGTTSDVGAKLYVDGGIRASGAFIGGGLLEFTGGWSASPYNSSSWIRPASGVGIFLVNNGITKWAGFKPNDDFDINGGALTVLSSNGNVGIGTTSPGYILEVNGTNGSIAVKGSGYTLNPIPMLIGQYTSTRGYIQVPNQGSVEIWNGGTSIIAEFKNNSDSIFYGNAGMGLSNPLATLATLGGAVQIMGDYRNHATIIKSAGTAGTLNGQLTITIPQMSNADSDGYGGYSCEVYVSGFSGIYCHAWFSGYINGGITPGEATILRSNGGWSISQSSYGANNQGFQFVINYPDALIHPTARIIFNKGGSPNATAYPANEITAVWS